MKKYTDIIVIVTIPGGLSDRKCAGLPDSLDFSSRTIVASTSSTPTGSNSSSAEALDVSNRGDFWTYSPANATLTVDLSAGIIINSVNSLKKFQKLGGSLIEHAILR